MQLLLIAAAAAVVQNIADVAVVAVAAASYVAVVAAAAIHNALGFAATCAVSSFGHYAGASVVASACLVDQSQLLAYAAAAVVVAAVAAAFAIAFVADACCFVAGWLYCLKFLPSVCSS